MLLQSYRLKTFLKNNQPIKKNKNAPADITNPFKN